MIKYLKSSSKDKIDKSPDDPASKFIRAGMWAATTGYVFSGLNYVGQVFLARLLAPSIYGEYAFCAAILEILGFIGTFSGTAGYINGEGTQRDFNACFFINIFASIIFVLIAFIGRSVFNTVYPDIANVFLILCLAQIFRLFANVYQAPLERNLEYKVVSLSRGVASFASLLIVIIIAFFKHSVWLLALRDVINFLLLFMLAYLYSNQRFTHKTGIKNIHSQMLFGGKMLSSRFLEVCFFKFPEIIIQFIAGKKILGNFYQARYLSYLPNKIVEPFTHQVLFAYLSKYKSSPDILSRHVSYINYILTRLLLPIVCAVYLFGSELFSLLYGEHWSIAADYFSQFFLFVLFAPLYVTLLITSYSLGKQKYGVIGYLLATVIFVAGTVIMSGSALTYLPFSFCLGLVFAYFYVAYKLRKDNIKIHLGKIFIKPTLIFSTVISVKMLFSSYWAVAIFCILFFTTLYSERVEVKQIMSKFRSAFRAK